MRLFTKIQHDYLSSIVEGRTTDEITKMINDKFSLSITARQIQIYKKNHGLKSNVSTRFEKGHIPANKGVNGVYNVGGNQTSFKPGQISHNYKAIGYERIDRDGYTLIKVSDEGPWHKRWKHKHKVLWEKENGPIPSGHALIFADSNRQNFDLNNLILVSKKQLMILNKKHLIQNDADLTRTGVIVANLYQKIYEVKKNV